MTAMEALQWACVVYWATSLLLLIASTAAALAQPMLAAREAKNAATPPVSFALPVKLADENFELAQESVFLQNYPSFEVVAAAIDVESPASSRMRAIFARHPERATRLLQSTSRAALSPKLDNLVAPFTQAAYDTIFMKDADAVLDADDLAEHMKRLTPDVGLVCAIPYGADARSLAAQIELSIFNNPHARMLSVAAVLRENVGVGKIMLFRRSDFQRAGGFAAMAHTVGEDNAFAKALARIGLRSVFSHRHVRQELGRRGWADVYHRQLRWSVIRRRETPATYFLEPLSFCFPTVVATWVGAPALGWPPFAAAVATSALWFSAECLLSFMKHWGLSWGAPVILPLREATMMTVWLHAWTTNRVVWARERFEARPGAASPPDVSASGPPLAARKKG